MPADEWDWWERTEEVPPRLPGGPRTGWARVRPVSIGAAPRADQRMGRRDLARMGMVMATEEGKTILEIVEEVARGDRTLTSQQMQAAIAALPYRHAKLSEVKMTATITKDAASLTDDELAAIAAGSGEAAPEPAAPAVKPDGMVH